MSKEVEAKDKRLKDVGVDIFFERLIPIISVLSSLYSCFCFVYWR